MGESQHDRTQITDFYRNGFFHCWSIITARWDLLYMPTSPDHHIEAATNDFAIRCFRNTADKDYIHARLAYRTRLTPQFRWSALHCLEKYAKCILLLNRIPCKKPRHEVTSILRLLAESGKFEVEFCDESKAFIKRLEHNAHHRYLETSYFSMPDDLHHLDQAVWEIRRYCQILDFEVETPSGPKNLRQAILNKITKARASLEKNTCFTGGWLEDVMQKDKHPAREALLWNNLFFGKSKRRRFRMTVYSESENAPLHMHPEILDEVLNYVFVPSDLVKQMRAV